MCVQRKKPSLLGCLFLAAVALLVAAPSALAQQVTMVAGFPQCIPATAHALVTVDVTPRGPYSFVRVYFKRHNEKDYYFIEMRANQDSGFWSVLPKPACNTGKVDMYIAVADAAGHVSRTAEQTIDVRSDAASCGVKLTQEQYEYAQNLTVGETVQDQKDKAVLGFCCDGIIARLETDGAIRADQVCRDQRLAQIPCSCAAVVAAGWRRVVPWIGLGAAAGGGIVAIEEGPKPECSPARP